MADKDSKRFYWLKLKKDFFHQHQLKVLKALPNGRTYALIYLELLAESTSHDGHLRYSELMPYDIVTLSAVIDEDKDTLQAAIDTLERLELVDILDDQTIYMRAIQGMIGSETGQTIRKREAKVVNVTNELPNPYQKNTLEYRDKSKENRDKNISRATNKFVPPSLDEVKAEILEKGYNIDAEKFIAFYESKGWMIGKNKMKSWKSALVTWNKRSDPKPPQELDPQTINPTYDDSFNPQMSEEELREFMKGIQNG